MRDTLNELQRAIEHEICRVIALRFTMENQRRADQMARLIEIKGLGADIAAVKKGIGELRAAATELNTEKSGLTAEIKDLTEQLKQHRADLRFEAETLGNSSGNTDTEETKVSSTASVAPANGNATSDCVALGPHPDQPAASLVAPPVFNEIKWPISPDLAAALLHHAHRIVDGPPEVIDEDVHPPLKLEAGTVPSPTFRAAE